MKQKKKANGIFREQPNVGVAKHGAMRVRVDEADQRFGLD